MGKNGATIRDLYQLVGETRTELLLEIKDLRADFNRLEEGRVTRLETKVAEMEGKGEGMNKTIVYLGIAVSIVVSLIGLFLKL